MKYDGWVPTVTGNLSFSTLGSGRFPARCNRKDGAHQFLVHQRRDLLDVLVPFADENSVVSFVRERISNWALRISGNFSFFLVATADNDDGSCSGKVYIISEEKEKSAKVRLYNFVNSKEPLDVTLPALIEELEKSNCYTAEIKLMRPGHLEIQAQPIASEFQEVDKLLANQVFYFLKDISHVHQHHDPRHDSITEITVRKDESDKWVTETQQCLYRSIIRYKRFRNEKALFRASGILAYAQAFQKAYPSPKDDDRRYFEEELEQSLAVSRDEIRHFDQKRLAQIETFRNFFFALFGLAISVSYLARLAGPDTIEVNPAIIELAKLLAFYPLEVVGCAVLASIAWMIYTHQLEPADSEIVRWFARVLQGFRLRYFMASNIVLTIVFCTVCYILLIVMAH